MRCLRHRIILNAKPIVYYQLRTYVVRHRQYGGKMKDGDKGKQRKMKKQRKQKIKTGSEGYLNLIGAWRFDGLLRGLLAILAFALVLTPFVMLDELLYRGNRQQYLQIPATFFFGMIMLACFYTLTGQANVRLTGVTKGTTPEARA